MQPSDVDRVNRLLALDRFADGFAFKPNEIINRERKYDQAIEAMAKEYDHIPDSMTFINEENLAKYLDEKLLNGQKFDRELLKKIFQFIDVEKNLTISKNQFISGYIQIEMGTAQQQKELTNLLNEKTEELNHLEAKKLSYEKQEEIQMARNPSILNSNIMEGAYLRVSVVEARNLVPSGGKALMNTYAILIIEGQKSTTKTMHSTCDPVWNEVHTFNIRSGEDPLIIKIFEKNVLSRFKLENDELIGECSVNLKNYFDQKEKEEIIQIGPPRNPTKKSTINLKILFLRKYSEFYDTIIKEKRQAIHDIEMDLEMVTRTLNIIREPFPFLSKSDFSGAKSNEKKLIWRPAIPKFLEDNFIRVVDIADQKLYSMNIGGLPQDSWSTISNLIFLMLTLITTMTKPDFVNLVIAMFALYVLSVNRSSSSFLLYYIPWCIGLSLVYDLFWLLFFTPDYILYRKVDGGIETSIRRFTLFFIVILAFYKLPLLILKIREYRDFINRENVPERTLNIQQNY